MNNESNLTQNQIESLIFTIRGFQVMIDRDLAEMYQVETKVLNQALKRNIERFPEQFRFQLEDKEKMELVTNCDRFVFMKHSSTNPYAFSKMDKNFVSIIMNEILEMV